MGQYLNTDICLKNYTKLYNTSYFVDKSTIIEDLNSRIGINNQYIYISRPIQFGKTSIADMIGAYYCKEVDSKEIFGTLKIKNANSYDEYLNKYNIIKISFNELTDNNHDTYENYIDRIKSILIEDIIKAYPNLKNNNYENKAISDLLMDTEDEFIFILDEWDYIFRAKLFEENQSDFSRFLMNLLKDKSYVALCYMTGVLPIQTYDLDMFNEFKFLKDRKFEKYFGFTEEEVKLLCAKSKNVSFKEIDECYDSYLSDTNIKLYDPHSVIFALENN